MVLVAAVLAAGVLRLEWGPHLLLFVYWVEAGVAAGRGALQSLFAELPPSEAYRPRGTRMPFPLESLADVRGGVRLGSWLPPVYPRNVPYVLLALIPIAAFWPLAGLLLTGAVEPFVGEFAPPETLALAVLAVVVNQTARFVGWLRSGAYESTAATGGSTRKYLVLVFVLAVVAPLAIDGAEAAGVGHVGLGLAAVGARVGYDLVELRYPEWAESTVFSGETVGDDRPVETPDGEPVASFRSDRRGTLAAAVISGVLASVLGLMLFPVLFGGLVGLVVGGEMLGAPYGHAVGAAVGVGAVIGCRVLVELVVGWVVSAHVVYHVYPDAVVARNELTGAAQWSVRRDEIEEMIASSDLFAAVLPKWYDTLKLSTAGGETHRMGYFGDVDSAARLLDGEDAG
ncbi:hypothetical protein C453_00695 [Haloferax elongans ATCC BAA-1513]|uniref:Multidrug ABC transporter ATPase n=2 Tax=Haloferax elongans TaxID=403191 RepID=M0I2E5_HALEO|nr:hypothetical protein C453_00695 [Haloferax elongans ATCC BAA-1513]